MFYSKYAASLLYSKYAALLVTHFSHVSGNLWNGSGSSSEIDGIRMTVKDVYDNFISGTLPDDPKFTLFHSLMVDFEDTSLLKGFKENDKVKIVGTLVSARVNGDASTYYRYGINLDGKTIEKLP